LIENLPAPYHLFNERARSRDRDKRHTSVAAPRHGGKLAGATRKFRQEAEVSTTRSVIGLVLWVGVSLGAGQTGNWLGGGDASFYQQLQQPAWAPPPWLFGPVWIVLYVMMGVAAWLVWRERGFGGARLPLTLFLVHLIFNAAWTGIFFGLRNFGLAFAEIVVLWLMILAVLLLFWRVRPLAGALLLPYLLWVTYAAALNFALWRMNPQF
jgi:translocator protein